MEKLPRKSVVDVENLHVLYLDEPGSAAEKLQGMLETASAVRLRVSQTGSFSTGLELLATGKVDAVLLADSLPGGSTTEHINTIRTTTPEVAILLLTDAEPGPGSLQAMREGVQDYLVRSKLDETALIRAIRYAVERQRMTAQLQRARLLEQYLAYHDILTGLPNRQLFSERLKQVISIARRYSRMLAVLFLDVNGLTAFNEQHGYVAGDQLLTGVAGRLENSVRGCDSVARVGGDEFAVLLQEIAHPQDAVLVARKLLDRIAEPLRLGEVEIQPSAAIGISLYPLDGRDVEVVLRNSDIALYRAKGQSGPAIQLYNRELETQAFERRELENSLQRALRNDELRLYYQPSVDLHSGDIREVEVLVRWEHPQLGLVSPNKFIPLAEETGLIEPIGEWILNTACTQSVQMQESGCKPTRITVNLGSRQFQRTSIADSIETALQNSGLSPHYLGVEIAENSIMQDVEISAHTLKKIKGLGVQIAVDDFGTGFSSLGHLRRFPLDVLKIDRRFIQGIPDDRNDTAVAAAIVALGHQMGLNVVAEGVETGAQASLLRSWHCDEMQGFHHSRPMEKQSLTQLLQPDAIEAD